MDKNGALMDLVPAWHTTGLIDYITATPSVFKQKFTSDWVEKAAKIPLNILSDPLANSDHGSQSDQDDLVGHTRDLDVDMESLPDSVDHVPSIPTVPRKYPYKPLREHGQEHGHGHGHGQAHGHHDHDDDRPEVDLTLAPIHHSPKSRRIFHDPTHGGLGRHRHVTPQTNQTDDDEGDKDDTIREKKGHIHDRDNHNHSGDKENDPNIHEGENKEVRRRRKSRSAQHDHVHDHGNDHPIQGQGHHHHRHHQGKAKYPSPSSSGHLPSPPPIPEKFPAFERKSPGNLKGAPKRPVSPPPPPTRSKSSLRKDKDRRKNSSNSNNNKNKQNRNAGWKKGQTVTQKDSNFVHRLKSFFVKRNSSTTLDPPTTILNLKSSEEKVKNGRKKPQQLKLGLDGKSKTKRKSQSNKESSDLPPDSKNNDHNIDSEKERREQYLQSHSKSFKVLIPQKPKVFRMQVKDQGKKKSSDPNALLFQRFTDLPTRIKGNVNRTNYKRISKALPAKYTSDTSDFSDDFEKKSHDPRRVSMSRKIGVKIKSQWSGKGRKKPVPNQSRPSWKNPWGPLVHKKDDIDWKRRLAMQSRTRRRIKAGPLNKVYPEVGQWPEEPQENDQVAPKMTKVETDSTTEAFTDDESTYDKDKLKVFKKMDEVNKNPGPGLGVDLVKRLTALSSKSSDSSSSSALSSPSLTSSFVSAGHRKKGKIKKHLSQHQHRKAKVKKLSQTFHPEIEVHNLFFRELSTKSSSKSLEVGDSKLEIRPPPSKLQLQVAPLLLPSKEEKFTKVGGRQGGQSQAKTKGQTPDPGQSKKESSTRRSSKKRSSNVHKKAGRPFFNVNPSLLPPKRNHNNRSRVPPKNTHVTSPIGLGHGQTKGHGHGQGQSQSPIQGDGTADLEMERFKHVHLQGGEGTPKLELEMENGKDEEIEVGSEVKDKVKVGDEGTDALLTSPDTGEVYSPFEKLSIPNNLNLLIKAKAKDSEKLVQSQSQNPVKNNTWTEVAPGLRTISDTSSFPFPGGEDDFLRRLKPSLGKNPRLRWNNKPKPLHLYFESKIMPSKRVLKNIYTLAPLTKREILLKYKFEENEPKGSTQIPQFRFNFINGSDHYSEEDDGGGGDSDDNNDENVSVHRVKLSDTSTAIMKLKSHPYLESVTRTSVVDLEEERQSVLHPRPPFNSKEQLTVFQNKKHGGSSNNKTIPRKRSRKTRVVRKL